MNELNEFLKTLNLDENNPIVIGLSGGPDSMALVDIIHKFNKNIKIICAHVHHNLRKESDLEKDFVLKYCEDNNFVFEFLKIDNYKNNKFTEQEAREIRYKFFEEVLKKYNAKYLFTAHHGDDLMETILMRLTRGSNFKGYSGIKLITLKKDYQIIRPLIFLTKDMIMEYVSKNKISYVNDDTNNSLKYTRNRYRIKILPVLKEENAKVHQKFYKFSNMISEYDDYVDELVNIKYEKIVKQNKIDLTLFKEEKKLIQTCIIQKYLDEIYGNNIVYINDKHKDEILKLALNQKPNLSIDLPINFKFIKEYNDIYILKNEINNEYKFELKDKLVLGDKIIEKVEDSNLTDNFVTYLDSSKITLPIYVRSYNQGDKIVIKNMNTAKKVKDIFINEKVPMAKRKNWPIVVDANNQILWLPGLKKSKFDSQKTGIYDIILRYY